jgi:ribosome-associated protein
MPKTPRKKTSHRSSPHPRRPSSPKGSGANKTSRTAEPHATRQKSKLTVAQVVADALGDLKALDVSSLDVRHLTTVTDTMIIASGRSDRHVRAIANAVVEKCKKEGHRPIGVEGQNVGEWVLVDLGDVVVHVMLPRARDFYNLEKLWDLAERDEVVERI